MPRPVSRQSTFSRQGEACLAPTTCLRYIEQHGMSSLEGEAMAGVIAGESAAYGAVPAPYAPSWVDRVTDWVRGLRVPYWLVYLVPALLLFALITVIKWEDGSYAAAYAAGNKAGLFKLGPIFIYPFHAVPELV